MARNRPTTTVNENLPQPEVKAEAMATAPPTLADQISALQKSLRTIRVQKTALEERCNTIEAELSRLFASASLERKKEQFLESLNAHEAELLKASKPA